MLQMTTENLSHYAPVRRLVNNYLPGLDSKVHSANKIAHVITISGEATDNSTRSRHDLKILHSCLVAPA
jgi:hypothetical protein